MYILLTLTRGRVASSINNAYIDYVRKAGYTPVLADEHGDIEDILALADGVILKGGYDVEPTYYGFDNTSSKGCDPEQDEFERNLYHKAKELKIPVLAICRGFQLVYLEEVRAIKGLTFSQHMQGHNQTNNDISRPLPFHMVWYFPRLYNYNSVLKDPKQTRRMAVNSLHHQGVKRTSHFHKQYKPNDSPIDILAMADDGTLEAYCVKDSKVLCVQWHPEEIKDVKLLHGFFGALNEQRTKTANADKIIERDA